jgi:hypothetical protein
MDINKIMEVVSQRYDDGLIAQCWDEKKKCPVSAKKAREAGDGLAYFIVIEISETYDPVASDAEQIAEAIRVMNSASYQLSEVIDGLEQFQDRLPSA